MSLLPVKLFLMALCSRCPQPGVMRCIHRISVQWQDAKFVSRLAWETVKAVIDSAQEGTETPGTGPHLGYWICTVLVGAPLPVPPSSRPPPCLLNTVQITETLESLSSKPPSCFQGCGSPGLWVCFPEDRPCQQCHPHRSEGQPIWACICGARVSTNMHRKLLEGKGRGRKRREGQGMEARGHFFLFPWQGPKILNSKQASQIVITVYVSGQKTERCIRLQNISVCGSVASLCSGSRLCVCERGLGGRLPRSRTIWDQLWKYEFSHTFMCVQATVGGQWHVAGSGGSWRKRQQINPSVNASEWPWNAMALGFWPRIVGNLWHEQMGF